MDERRKAVARIQRAHWNLMLKKRRQGEATPHELAKHYREYVEGAPALVESPRNVSWLVHGNPAKRDLVEEWFRRWT